MKAAKCAEILENRDVNSEIRRFIHIIHILHIVNEDFNQN